MTAAWRGAAAAVAALAAMAGVAAVGLLLLDAGRFGGFGRVTAAVVAMALGGSAEFGAVPAGGAPFAVRGGLDLVPSGVALTGAVVLGWLLLRRRDGLPVRCAAAAAVFPVGAVAVAVAARGAVTLPGDAAGGVPGVCGLPAVGPFGRGGPLGRVGSADQLGVGFSVPVWPVAVGSVVWVLVVVGVCLLVARRRIAARGALWAAGGLTAACLLVAWALGGPAVAGGALLLLPSAVFGVLSPGLGVPWSVGAGGALACVLDGVAPPAPGGPPTWVAVAVLTALGVVVALAGGRGGLPRRVAWHGAVAGVALGVLAWLSRASVRLGVEAFGFSFPVFDAWAAADPLTAVGLGAAGGVVGSVLVEGFLRVAPVSWPPWRDRVG
ncbi:streptophobe family protein [Saccharothrix xinjiangensis]|uniref:Streptophobe family protein n=1 Tax=Saccharothrix xinjiangensis TaxID=204798 RepID=A0ABV9YB50_9PSEU